MPLLSCEDAERVGVGGSHELAVNGLLLELAGRTGEPPFLPAFFASPALKARRSPAAPLQNDAVLTGGMPAVALGQVSDRALWFRGFEQTYLERDVRDLARVADLVGFRHLIQLAALRSAQIDRP